jgi:branched-chain amino acid transport system substrate-binding protein
VRARIPRRAGSAFVYVSASIAGALILAACSSSSSSSSGTTASDSSTPAASGAAAAGNCGSLPSGSTIRLGIVDPLSGPFAATGLAATKSLKVAVDAFNAASNVCGHKFSIVAYDDKGDPATSLTQSRSLVADGITIVVGESLGPAQDLIHPYFMQQKVLVLGQNGNPAKVEPAQGNPYAFSDYPLDPQYADNVLNYAKAKGYNDIGLLGDGSSFSQGLATSMQASIQSHGLKLIKQVNFAPTAVDVTTQLTQLKEAGVQTVIITNVAGSNVILSSLKQMGWAPHLLSWGILNQAGTTASQLPYPGIADGCTVYYSAPGAESSVLTPDVKTILNSSVAAQGLQPTTSLSLIYYSDLLILKAAIEKAGSLAGDKLTSAIESVGTIPSAIPGVTFSFSSTQHGGFPTSAMAMCSLEKRGPYDILYKLPAD